MCGFVGILHRDADREVDRDLIERMNSTIAHRGPDSDGVYFDAGLGFGHRRLSIIDIHSGHQPMIECDPDRSIVYNGEIYNHLELRDSEFSASDPSFNTHCDTEVLLRMSRFDSFEWLEKLNGMFAFALWDRGQRRLLLARDRLGIKPLYYVNLGNAFVFASEIKALLVYPEVLREVNVSRISEYLAFRTIAGEETLFKGIYELPPGHALTIGQDEFNPTLKRYWGEGDGYPIGDYVDTSVGFEAQFETLLTDAVRYRLISDVPVGSFNSGGVDSSLVSSVMRSLTEGEMHTFSVGFDESEYDERKFAQIVASKLGTNHHTLVMNERMFVDHLEQALLHLESPLNHANTVSLMLLSELARQYVTVILTGEGADELFGGYPRMQIPLLCRYLHKLPALLTRGLRSLSEAVDQRRLVKLLEISHDLDRSVLENSRYVPAADFERMHSETLTLAERRGLLQRSMGEGGSFMHQILHFDQRTYLPSILSRLDKVSMAHSLECRVPFLDYKLVEWSYRLPDKYKMRIGRENKFIVKKVAESWLPHGIAHREKVGFGTPIGDWFRNPGGLGEYLELISDATFRDRGYFDGVETERLMHEHLVDGQDHSEVLWGLVNFELWCRTFIDNDPVSGIRNAPH